MQPERYPARARHESVAQQEERTWVAFYPEVRNDPALAAEVLAELERDDVVRRRHRALYLCCQRSLRRHESRSARQRRIGSFVRSLVRAVLIDFPKTLFEAVRESRDLAVACLPEQAEDTTAQQRQQRARNVDLPADLALEARARRAADRTRAAASLAQDGLAGDMPESRSASR